MKNNFLIEQLPDRLCSKENLKKKILLKPEEEQYFSMEEKHPFAVTGYYFSLIDKSDPEDPVRKQCFPTLYESKYKEYESSDPLCETDFSPVPGLVHRYNNRVLLLLTDTCAVYCRHCFRRSFTGHNSGIISQENLEKSLEYINNNKEIKELLISGGDPLTLDNEMLDKVFHKIKQIKRRITVRICTRIPVVLPERITGELIKIIKQMDFPVWILTQFNHYKEITAQSIKAVKMLSESGLPVLNQTVLLKGINDNRKSLVRLFTELVLNRVKPLYIFQGDLACGTAHFRTNLNKGIELIKEVYSEVSGIARPFYAVDLPGGGGKIILNTDSDYICENGFYKLYDNSGKEYFYPDEPDR